MTKYNFQPVVKALEGAADREVCIGMLEQIYRENREALAELAVFCEVNLTGMKTKEDVFAALADHFHPVDNLDWIQGEPEEDEMSWLTGFTSDEEADEPEWLKAIMKDQQGTEKSSKPKSSNELPEGWEDTVLSELYATLPPLLKWVPLAAMKPLLPDDYQDSLLAAISSGVGTLIVSSDRDPGEKSVKLSPMWQKLIGTVVNTMNPSIKDGAKEGLQRITEEEWKLVKFNTGIIFFTNLLIRARGHAAAKKAETRKESAQKQTGRYK